MDTILDEVVNIIGQMPYEYSEMFWQCRNSLVSVFPAHFALKWKRTSRFTKEHEVLVRVRFIKSINILKWRIQLCRHKFAHWTHFIIKYIMYYDLAFFICQKIDRITWQIRDLLVPLGPKSSCHIILWLHSICRTDGRTTKLQAFPALHSYNYSYLLLVSSSARLTDYGCGWKPKSAIP